MRAAFVDTLCELAEEDERIVLLTGDLGFGVLERFADRFGSRFFNAGVAEQNMMGIATGLAEGGMIPFAYSIATFAVLRAYEFVRNGPVLHQLPVRIIGVGAGMEYGALGHTHHAVEDIAVTRPQPGLRVVVPADAGQAKAALRATWQEPGPVYYRLGKDEDARVPGLRDRFDPGRVTVLREGADVLLLSAGSVSIEVVAAAEELAARGVQSTVAVVACPSPAPSDLAALVGRFDLVATVEEHYRVGGIGSLVAETVTDHGYGCRVLRLGLDGVLRPRVGNGRYLRTVHGLDRDGIVATVAEARAGRGTPSA